MFSLRENMQFRTIHDRRNECGSTLMQNKKRTIVIRNALIFFLSYSLCIHPPSTLPRKPSTHTHTHTHIWTRMLQKKCCVHQLLSARCRRGKLFSFRHRKSAFYTASSSRYNDPSRPPDLQGRWSHLQHDLSALVSECLCTRPLYTLN